MRNEVKRRFWLFFVLTVLSLREDSVGQVRQASSNDAGIGRGTIAAGKDWRERRAKDAMIEAGDTRDTGGMMSKRVDG